jgi:NAD(P)-dependent dehydrogenase (short-subunit alcohol dehydrogenase family)
VGGTAGIGLASARALAAAGVPRIVVVGRNAERGQLAAKSIAELGAAAHFVAGDATDPGAAATVAAEADQILFLCSPAAAPVDRSGYERQRRDLRDVKLVDSDARPLVPHRHRLCRRGPVLASM